jgi:hypothetical protein
MWRISGTPRRPSAYRRGHVGRRIRHQHGVEQRLVPRLQVGEHEILQQIVVEIGDLGMAAGDLQIDARHGGGQQTFKPPCAAIRHGERRPSGGVSGGLVGHFDCPVLRCFGAASELAHFAAAT